MTLVQAESIPAQPWRNGGGRTRELLVWPNAGDWRLRISRADIEADGPFSAYAGVQRWFVVLSGKGVVLCMPTPDQHSLDHHLAPGHTPLHFDGGLAPDCKLEDGPTQDLNLMTRSGQAGMLTALANTPWLPDYAMCGLYTAHSGVWTDGLQNMHLPAHSLLWLERAPATAMRFAPDTSDLLCAYWLGYTPEPAP